MKIETLNNSRGSRSYEIYRDSLGFEVPVTQANQSVSFTAQVVADTNSSTVWRYTRTRATRQVANPKRHNKHLKCLGRTRNSIQFLKNDS